MLRSARVSGGGTVSRWDRSQAVGRSDPAFDDLDGVALLVLEGVTADDDERLAWCRLAPCPVLGLTPTGRRPPTATDLALAAGEPDVLLLAPGGSVDEAVGSLAERAATWREAARVLVDVLRATSALAVRDALVVESLAYSMLLAGPAFRDWLATGPARGASLEGGEPVRLERDGDTLRITLVRPDTRNSFSAALRDELVAALTVAALDDSIVGISLGGEGPSFSSGGNLGEFGSSTDDVVRAHEIRTLRSAGEALARVAERTTAFVQGPCVGAGVELSAFAGHVVAAPDATFLLPELRMGLVPGAGGTVSLPRRLGRQRTALLALLDSPIDATTALRWGLVDAIDGR